MKRCIYRIFVCIAITPYLAKSQNSNPTTIEAKAGQEVILSFADNPQNFDINENNKMRYAQFECKSATHTCTLKVKKRIPATETPITFAIFDKAENGKLPKVKAYVKIDTNKNRKKRRKK